ncbi:hypothetical protein ARMSODRAFT_603302 [Armillaria solidipes]|uniref:Uncharacterized protein n=1 Tax=Armillaria solidipes TaxID=1076256 RepID=A0A2H3B697_9AGAR|nr:hypothetical protein ARMSODRAFT_603302 [Armillaria solidipes]
MVLRGTAHFAAEINWSLIYALLTLTTMLACSLLIIYRIIQHAPWISTSPRIVVIMLIRSSGMYLLSLILNLSCTGVEEFRIQSLLHYADTIAAYIKAIAPTLLVGRVSAYANQTLIQFRRVKRWSLCRRTTLHWSAVLRKTTPTTAADAIVWVMVIKCRRDRRARRMCDLALAVLSIEVYLGCGR